MQRWLCTGCDHSVFRRKRKTNGNCKTKNKLLYKKIIGGQKSNLSYHNLDFMLNDIKFWVETSDDQIKNLENKVSQF